MKLKGQRLKTAYSSDLFVLTDETKTLHKVVKIDYLLTLDNEDGKVFIQNLDEIQQNIKLAKPPYTTKNEPTMSVMNSLVQSTINSITRQPQTIYFNNQELNAIGYIGNNKNHKTLPTIFIIFLTFSLFQSNSTLIPNPGIKPLSWRSLLLILKL